MNKHIAFGLVTMAAIAGITAFFIWDAIETRKLLKEQVGLMGLSNDLRQLELQARERELKRKEDKPAVEEVAEVI